MALLELKAISKTFSQGRQRNVHAVADVSLSISKGETVGLVGESGCGKSTLARLALKLVSTTSGQVLFDGIDITNFNSREMLAARRRLQAVFQDPLASLNARMSIAEVMREPFDTHAIDLGQELEHRIRQLLSLVGLENLDVGKLPGQFSGGQLQRIAIARALSLEPDLIVADEPTSALDPSIQAQIINLMLRIQRRSGIAYLIISHDLDVIGHMADRIAVMYLGSIIEHGKTDDLMSRPLHPYTHALLSAAPTLIARRQTGRTRFLLSGDPPNPASVPMGCRFHPRCGLAQDICRTTVPKLRPISDRGHTVACHFAPEMTAQMGIQVAQSRMGLSNTEIGEYCEP